MAAFYVMVYHLVAWGQKGLPSWIASLQRPLLYGHAAVSVFIVLSGFSLGLPLARSAGLRLRQGVAGYLYRRGRRILPPYFAALGLSIVVVGYCGHSFTARNESTEWTPGSLLTHVLLVHNLFEHYATTLNMALWSVGAEWQIYFLLPLVFLPTWRLLGRGSVLAVSILIPVALLMLLPADRNLAWTCPWYISLFAAGLIASSFEFRQFSRFGRLATTAGIIACGLAFLAVCRLWPRTDPPTPAVEMAKDLLTGVAVALLLVLGSADTAGAKPPRFVRVLQSTVPRVLGSFSYSLYLVHCVVLTACLWFAWRNGFSDMSSFWLRVTVGVPMSLAVAYVFYWLFERPLLSASLRRSK